MSGLRCQIQRGVMTLRPCGEPATNHCTTCQRLTCPEHFSTTGVLVCLECAARKSGANPPPPSAITDYDSPGWSYGLRNWILLSSADPGRRTYRESDLRSFDHRRDDDAIEPQSSAGGSFLDS